ncbi:MAG TPA: CRISPR-associated protein Csx11 [Anaerolineae bacterium]|nr:CRISPR-associated protein Csx11 [Anaerolineae bacterium]HXK42913.1 CRISPR-associated protein Csx11 [Anaerolineae bacterium]
MNQLDVLGSHREALLLAEAIGWLHDYRKCSDEHLKTQAANPSGQQALPRSELAKRCPKLTSASLQLPVQSAPRTVADLLDDGTWSSDSLGQFLSRCHNTAHFDKQEPVGGQQDYPRIKISTPFGFEKNVPSNLTNQLWGLPWDVLCGYNDTQRGNLQWAVSNLFSQTLADTRRPINEVDLWSWGLLVGALYKSALAGALLMGSNLVAHDLRWRLLGIQVNGLDYLLDVVRVPDLLARKELLSQSLNQVRELLEVTYPLGSEVYRDENGSVYVVPDVPDLLERTDSNGTNLRMLILRAFSQGTLWGNPKLQLGGELLPQIELEQTPWWGQDPDYQNKTEPQRGSPLLGQQVHDELPAIEHFVSQSVISLAHPKQIGQFWQGGTVADICTVCGLRPQGPGPKASERNVCDICEERRADRSKEWAISQQTETIWTDEVADSNGCLALIVGQFDLTHWLDGSLLESLLLIAPRDPQNTRGAPITSKTPSFSRLQRVWETTHRYWQEVQDDIGQKLTDDRRRLQIYLDATPDLGPFHVYDLTLGVTDLSVVWVPPQGNNAGYLISADNLSYIARQLDAGPAIFDSPATAAIFVEDYLNNEFVKGGRQPILRNPDARLGGRDANLLASIRITNVAYQETSYATVIPILAEPRLFMTLVPADTSLHLLCAIKKKYEREMGKVLGRLPLHLGIVYADRRTPIRAVLDAGRAMLEYRSLLQPWIVKSVNKSAQETSIDLERKGCQITYRIPHVMGDGATEDRWSPYFFLETNGDDGQADASNRRAVKVTWPAQGKHPEEGWIVHAADLREEESVHIWPSTFDFEFLDTTARRFEIVYDANGRRPRYTRPFYLEDLERLETLWTYMARLTKTQRHQVVRTIEATREAWYGQDREHESAKDEVFEQFVADTLAGATWPPKQSWDSIGEDWQKRLIQAGVRGELADLAELHMEILKE